MGNEKEGWADDVNRDNNVNWKNDDNDLNQYKEPADKWNAIQEEYISRYPELDTEDLYYESGGFEGVLEKISEIRGKSVDEIRTEIENW